VKTAATVRLPVENTWLLWGVVGDMSCDREKYIKASMTFDAGIPYEKIPHNICIWQMVVHF
jgi:hypothetical protein